MFSFVFGNIIYFPGDKGMVLDTSYRSDQSQFYSSLFHQFHHNNQFDCHISFLFIIEIEMIKYIIGLPTPTLDPIPSISYIILIQNKVK